MQTGVAACSGQQGCGQPGAEGRFETPWEDVCVERGGQDWHGDEWWWQGWEVKPVALKEDLGCWVVCWVGDVELEETGVGVEVWEAGVVDDPGADSGWLIWTAVGRRGWSSLLLWALKSSFCCSSTTFCADSWSCTHIMWAPTPKLMFRDVRPDRKSLICQKRNTSVLKLESLTLAIRM